jgi:hypothetical protein
MPSVLCWSGGDATLDEVHDAYLLILSDALGACLRTLRAQSPDRSRTALKDEERPVAFDRLRMAFELVSATGLSEFVTTFTKVLVLIRNETARFSSGSETRYIGRSVLGNPHSAGIDHLDIAEALVHEAIHALLYMEERPRAWVPAALYAPVPRVVSPWTGRNPSLAAVPASVLRMPLPTGCLLSYSEATGAGTPAREGDSPPSRAR